MDFFILGNPRSGTTLLRLLLNNHSEIAVPPESGFLQWWYKKYKTWSYNNIDQNLLDIFLDDILSSKKIEDWNINRDKLSNFIKEIKPNNYYELMRCVYEFYTKHKRLIGDKNNYYINHLNEIKLICPYSKYIHIVRDGRDVACSYKKINQLDSDLKYLPKVSSDIEEIAKEWNDNVSKIEHFITTESSITIKYEDLIGDPALTLNNICKFLEVPFKEEMLNYHQSIYNDEPKSTLHWKGKTQEAIDPSNKRKFISLMNNKEIEKFNKIAKYNLNKFNYI